MDEVTLGEHAEQAALIVYYWRTADVVVGKQARGLSHGRAGSHGNDRPGHDIDCSHGIPLNVIGRVTEQGLDQPHENSPPLRMLVKDRAADMIQINRVRINPAQSAVPPSETHANANADYQRVDLERPKRCAVRRRAGAHPDFLDVEVDEQTAGNLHVDTRLQRGAEA